MPRLFAPVPRGSAMFDTFFGMRASSDADARVVQRFVGEDDVPENAKEEKGMVPFCIPEGLSVGVRIKHTKFVEWPVVFSTPFRSSVMYRGHS